MYDLRNEDALTKITSRQTRLTTDISKSSSNVSIGNISQTTSGGKSAWSDWWRDKKRNNQDLLLSAEVGNVEDVVRLLDKTQLQDLIADLNHRGLDQWTALHFAANEGHVTVIAELLKHPDLEREPMSSINRTPLHLAAIRGHTHIVRLLLETPPASTVDRNSRDFDENTPLHYASEYGHAECIIYLVKEAQADPFLKNKFGYTPSDIA